MKLQDLSFLVVMVVLIFLRKPKLFVIAGLLSLVLAMPLFYFHVFFTAERLTWYAGGSFFLSLVILIVNELYDNRH